MNTLKNLGIIVFAIMATMLTSCKEEISLMPESALSTSSDAAIVGGEKITLSALPVNITTYVSTKYTNVSITKAEKYATKIEVTLSNGVKLEFTLAGVFIEVSGGGNSSSTSTSITVTTASLPASIATYISTKYPNTSITKAEKSSTKYEITLSNGVKLEFTLAGVFIEVSGVGNSSDDPIISLPQAAKDYIAANHKGATIVKAESSSTQIEVTLSNAYKLTFTLAGKLIESKFIGSKSNGKG